MANLYHHPFIVELVENSESGVSSLSSDDDESQTACGVDSDPAFVASRPMTMTAKRRAVYQGRLGFDSDASSISYDYDDGQTASRVPAEKTNEAKHVRQT